MKADDRKVSGVGRLIVERFVQPIKAEAPSSRTVSGTWTSFRVRHPANVSDGIAVIPRGISTLCSAVQSLKHPLPIWVIRGDSRALSSEVQPKKTRPPSVMTEGGSIARTSDVQSRNALVLTCISPVSPNSSDRVEQPRNAKMPIIVRAVMEEIQRREQSSTLV